MAKYMYLIEYYFKKEPWSIFRSFFSTDEEFKECKVTFFDVHSRNHVAEELYSYFMYDSQKRGKAHYIDEDNPIFVKVIDQMDKSPEADKEFNAEEFWEEICPYKYKARVDEILKDINTTFKMETIQSKKNGKLQQTAIFLLLYKRCNLFNNMPFKNFRKLLTQYYKIDDTSYKENNCTNGFKCDANCEECFMTNRSTGMCAKIFAMNRTLFTNKMKR